MVESSSFIISLIIEYLRFLSLELKSVMLPDLDLLGDLGNLILRRVGVSWLAFVVLNSTSSSSSSSSEDETDEDDDGDLILTRNEDTNQNTDPSDDITDPNVGPDYLNGVIQTEFVNNLYLDHTKNQTYTCNVTVQNISLQSTATNETIVFEDQNLGAIITPVNNVSFEVIFN